MKTILRFILFLPYILFITIKWLLTEDPEKY